MRKLLRPLAIVVLATSGQASYGSTNSFELNTSINGSTLSDSSRWMSETFAHGVSGHVSMTLTNRTGSNQLITSLAFNSLGNPGALTFTWLDAPSPLPITTGQGPVQNPAGGNQVKAGLFNNSMDFPTPNDTKSDQGRITNGNGAVIHDIAATDLTADSFLLPSVPGGPGNNIGGHFLAAKVQGIPGGVSDSDAISESETYAMLLAGLGLMGFVARRRTRVDAAA